MAVRVHPGLGSESRFGFYFERAHLPSPPTLAGAEIALSLGAPLYCGPLHGANKSPGDDPGLLQSIGIQSGKWSWAATWPMGSTKLHNSQWVSS
jgi:hypothetical protein